MTLLNLVSEVGEAAAGEETWVSGAELELASGAEPCLSQIAFAAAVKEVVVGQLDRELL